MSTPGRTIRFPRNRKLVLDICWAAQSVPAFSVERAFELNELQTLRNQSEPRFSWVTLFLKAYGLTGVGIPELRQVYSAYPWRRLYEHPCSVASISIHRDDPNGGKRLIWARIVDVERMPLQAIQAALDNAIHGPLTEVFRDGIRVERLPTFIRRISWWLGMNVQGRQKAKKVGTCSISTLASEDSLNRSHPLVVTSSLAYGRCAPTGSCLVTLLADHRVLDGVLAAQALRRIEHHLRTSVVDELKQIAAAGKQ